MGLPNLLKRVGKWNREKLYIENRIERKQIEKTEDKPKRMKFRLVFLKVEKGKLQRSKQKQQPIYETHEENKILKESSSEKERKENALALGADEGRDKLRKATGRRK